MSGGPKQRCGSFFRQGISTPVSESVRLLPLPTPANPAVGAASPPPDRPASCRIGRRGTPVDHAGRRQSRRGRPPTIPADHAAVPCPRSKDPAVLRRGPASSILSRSTQSWEGSNGQRLGCDSRHSRRSAMWRWPSMGCRLPIALVLCRCSAVFHQPPFFPAQSLVTFPAETHSDDKSRSHMQ